MASIKIIEQKKEIVENLSEKIKSSSSVVVVDYRGITVEQDTQLRGELRKNGVEYKVIKNGIMNRAFEKAGYTDFESIFKGPTAVAFASDDATAPARVLNDFTKKTKITIKGGMLEGKKLDAAGVASVAAIPSKQVLIGQLLGLLTNPMRSLAVALSEVAKKKA